MDYKTVKQPKNIYMRKGNTKGYESPKMVWFCPQGIREGFPEEAALEVCVQRRVTHPKKEKEWHSGKVPGIATE